MGHPRIPRWTAFALLLVPFVFAAVVAAVTATGTFLHAGGGVVGALVALGAAVVLARRGLGRGLGWFIAAIAVGLIAQVTAMPLSGWPPGSPDFAEAAPLSRRVGEALWIYGGSLALVAALALAVTLAALDRLPMAAAVVGAVVVVFVFPGTVPALGAVFLLVYMFVFPRDRVASSRLSPILWLRWGGIGALAGGAAAAFVGGVFGRLSMHLVALSAPEKTGVSTDNGVVGQFTLAGSFFLAVLTGLLFGVPGGLMYVLVRPLLAPLRGLRGFVFGLGLLAVFGFAVFASQDFSRFGDPLFNVAAFAPLIIVFGVLLEPVVRWLDRRVELRRPRWFEIPVFSAVALALAVAVLFILLSLQAVAIEIVSGGYSPPLGYAGLLYVMLAVACVHGLRHRDWQVQQSPRQQQLAYGLLALPALFGLWLTVDSLRDVLADRGSFPARINLPYGFLPEGIESGRGTEVFVGSLFDGDIWRGDVRTGEGEIFVDGDPPQASVGMAYEAGRNRLWVAGGGPGFDLGVGDVRVYDASSGELLATFHPEGVGFLNDVAITRDAVYLTDSFNPQLVVIPLPADGSLRSAAELLPVTGDFAQTPGTNLNGIVVRSGLLVAAQSSTGKLFRVDPATGIAEEIDLSGGQLASPDGLELRGTRSYVVGNNQVTVVRLRPHLATGVVLGGITDPGLDVPTTATVAAGRLWTVSSRLDTAEPGPTTEYWITQLPLRPRSG